MEDLKELVGTDLSLRTDLLDHIDSEEKLLELIEQYVEELINSDFERLLQLLYRLDVGEANVKKAIDDTEGAFASKTIAKLILKREHQKLLSRKKYRSNDNDDWIF